MADNLIPGLDGDLPPDRGHLPDSLQVKTSNGEAGGYVNQQTRPGQPADPTTTHPKVGSGHYLGYYCSLRFSWMASCLVVGPLYSMLPSVIS